MSSLEQARAWAASEQVPQAILAYVEWLEANEPTIEALLELADLFEQNGHPRRALNCLKQAQLLDEENEDLEYRAFMLSMLLQHHSNQFNEEMEDEARALDDEGQQLRLVGKVEEALEVYQDAVKQYADYATLWNNKGMVHHQQEQFDEAEQAYGRALEINPNFVLAQYNFGALKMRQGEPALAMAYLQHASQLDDADADIWYNLGMCMQQLNAHEEAIQYFRETLILRYDYDAAIFAIAVSFSGLQNREKTIMWVKKLAAKRPEWVMYVHGEEAFDWLRADEQFQLALGGMNSFPEFGGEG